MKSGKEKEADIIKLLKEIRDRLDNLATKLDRSNTPTPTPFKPKQGLWDVESTDKGAVPDCCKNCESYLRSKSTGQPLVCWCALPALTNPVMGSVVGSTPSIVDSRSFTYNISTGETKLK